MENLSWRERDPDEILTRSHKTTDIISLPYCFIFIYLYIISNIYKNSKTRLYIEQNDVGMKTPGLQSKIYKYSYLEGTIKKKSAI